jgi:hypothetical protein
MKDAEFDDKVTSSLQLCHGFEFRESGYVSQARAGEIVDIHCPTDYVYDGPAIECNWVDRVCIGLPHDEVNPELCWNQYNLTLPGRGLTVWPDGVRPRMISPPGAGKNSTWHLQGIGGLDSATGGEPDGGGLETALDEGTAVGRRLLDVRPRVLPTIIQPEQLVCKDEAFVNLDFDHAEVTHSNLGGRGPDKHAPQSLHYRRIARTDDDQVDLVVTTPDGDYLGLPERNGKGSVMGRINLNSSSPIHLRFQFVKSGTESPVELPKVLFTLFDLLDDGDHTGIELEVLGPSECFAPARMATHVWNAGKDPDGVPRYTIGVNKKDKRSAPDRALQDPGLDPQDPDRDLLSSPEHHVNGKSVREMWLDSVNQSAVFVFKGRSEFSVVARTRRGRDLEFAGWSEVADMGQKVGGEADGPGSPRFEEKFGDSSGLARRGSWVFDGFPLGSVSSLGISAVAISTVVVSRLAKGAWSRRAQYGILRAA